MIRHSTFILLLTTVLFLCFVTSAHSQNNINKKDETKNEYIQEVNQISSLINSKEGVDKIKSLVSKKNINVIDSTGFSLLSQAIRTKNVTLAKIFLKHGANPNLKNKDFLESTSLMQCTNVNSVDMVILLLDNGADVNIQDNHGDSAIHWSAYYGQVEITRLFMEHGANPNLISWHSDGVMIVALKEWKEDIVDLLLEYNVSMNIVLIKDKPTIEAVSSGSFKNVISLKKNLNANAIDASGTPVLIKSASNGYPKIVKYLVSNGADINVMNPAGHTALNRAIYFGHNDVVNYLLSKGADIDKTDDRFKLSPLIAAARSNNLVSGKLLLENGAEVNNIDGIAGMTPIMWAAAYQHTDFVKLLLKYKPDLSISSIYEDTVFTITKNEELLSLLKEIKKKSNRKR